ncbi:unnamed protein product, partial [Mesorhabditis spiculigera]
MDSVHPTGAAQGQTPDSEIKIIPRWLIFRPKHGFRSPVVTTFVLENLDPFPVAYAIKGRDRHFPIVKQVHGMIAAKSQFTMEFLVPARNDWPQDCAEMTNKRFKLAVLSLAVSQPLFDSLQENERPSAARDLFRATPPTVRLYTKLSYVLIRPDDVEPAL